MPIPFRGDRSDLLRRFWVTLGALIVYRVGTCLPIPGLDPVKVSEFFRMGQFGIVSLFDGGTFRRLSIFALGIAPYVSAFIIVQLASTMVPRLARLAAEGPAGRRALNQYARILTIVLAGLQAYGLTVGIEDAHGLVVVPSRAFEAVAVPTLVAGAICLMWLSERITERGIGDGVLLILACGVASRLPAALASALDSVRMGGLDVLGVYAALLMTLPVVVLVAVIEGAVRWIPIHDPGGALGMGGGSAGDYAQLPLRVNPAGILAPLAASVLAPPLWGIILSIGGRNTPILTDLARNGIGYGLVDGFLIALFAVFYGLVAMDPVQIATSLKDSGGSIPGCRSGQDAARHLRRTLAILALICTGYLLVACVLPNMICKRFHLPVAFSGFSFFLLAWVMLRILERIRLIFRQ